LTPGSFLERRLGGWVEKGLSFPPEAPLLAEVFLDGLKAVLEEVREKGYAVNNGELALELISVAAPVRDKYGKVVAALNMAVNAAQYDKERVGEELAPIVKQVALKISSAIGFFEEAPDE